jgi:hypothetical protein
MLLTGGPPGELVDIDAVGGISKEGKVRSRVGST